MNDDPMEPMDAHEARNPLGRSALLDAAQDALDARRQPLDDSNVLAALDEEGAGDLADLLEAIARLELAAPARLASEAARHRPCSGTHRHALRDLASTLVAAAALLLFLSRPAPEERPPRRASVAVQPASPRLGVSSVHVSLTRVTPHCSSRRSSSRGLESASSRTIEGDPASGLYAQLTYVIQKRTQ